MAQHEKVVIVQIGKKLNAPLYGATTLTREEVEDLLGSAQSNRRVRGAAAKLKLDR